MNMNEELLTAAFQDIESLADGMQLPAEIREDAKTYYRAVQEKKKKSLSGHQRDASIAATIYISCCMARKPRTFKEIAANGEVSEQEIKKQHSAIKKLLNLGGGPMLKAGDYMERFVSNLNLPFEIVRAAKHVATEADKSGWLSGKSPISVAAAAIYFITLMAPPDQQRTRDSIAGVAGVSWSTIRQRYNVMVDMRDKIMPPPEIWAHALEYASEELQNDKEVVLAAVKQYGHALEYASEELRNDREVVLAAVKQHGHALMYASMELQNDREVVLAAVKRHGVAVGCASKELWNDKEVVLAAVRQNGLALMHASEELQNDREVVLAAVKQHGYALKYASKELSMDKEVVLAAVKQDGYALGCASKELWNDREVVLAAVKRYGVAVGCASKELRNDREVVFAAVKKDGYAVQYASEELRNDKEVVLAAVKQHGSVLHKASKQLQNDKEVVLAAVKQDGWALKYASEELRNDGEVVAEAVKQNTNAFFYATRDQQSRIRGVMSLAAANRHMQSQARHRSSQFLMTAQGFRGLVVEGLAELKKRVPV